MTAAAASRAQVAIGPTSSTASRPLTVVRIIGSHSADAAVISPSTRHAPQSALERL